MADVDGAMVPGRKVIPVKWLSMLNDGDAVIAREETPNGPRFVVHSRGGPQFMCRTYAEAEARTLAYTGRAHADAWYADGRRLQLVGTRHHTIAPATGPEVGIQDIK